MDVKIEMLELKGYKRNRPDPEWGPNGVTIYSPVSRRLPVGTVPEIPTGYRMYFPPGYCGWVRIPQRLARAGLEIPGAPIQVCGGKPLFGDMKDDAFNVPFRRVTKDATSRIERGSVLCHITVLPDVKVNLAWKEDEE